MAKSTKVLDLEHNGAHYVCIKKLDGSVNPYWLYEKYYGYKNHRFGEHQKLIVKYAEMRSVLYLLMEYV